jgi:multiple sugar transport system permease protein/raffinose/stachyose/melibiose transport system permease protein
LTGKETCASCPELFSGQEAHKALKERKNFLVEPNVGFSDRKLRRHRGYTNSGYLFITPVMLFFFLFVFFPIIYIIRSSLFRWDGINAAIFIGLKNYISILKTDTSFRIALRNSVYWMILTIALQCLLGFILAYILNTKMRGRIIFRTIFYMPAIISPVVVAIVFMHIYNPFGGLLSSIGNATGLRFLTEGYISDPTIAIFSVIAVNIWQWSGFAMLMYLAGLQGIPEEIIDASLIDGFNTGQRIRYITLPLLSHVTKTLVLLTVIGTWQTFALPWVLTEGGPDHATEMLPTYIFKQGFQLEQMGYASALSVILLIICLTLSILQVRFLGSRFALNE